MGATEGKSMLYLEARCIAVTRAAGAQGVQNGGIDGVNVTASVPDGMREVIAENLCVMLHDLESCTGNDTLMSASDIRRTAHTLPLLLAGLRLPVLGLRLDSRLRQRLRPVELQRRGHRRLPRHPARLGLRGRPALPSRRRAPRRFAGARPRRAAPSSRSSGWRRSPTRMSTRASSPHGSLDVPELAPATLVPTAGTGSWTRASRSSTWCASLARARVRSRGRARPRDAAPAPARRLPPDVRDLRRGHARAVEPQRPERLRGARLRLSHDAGSACERSRRSARSGRRATSRPSRSRGLGCLDAHRAGACALLECGPTRSSSASRLVSGRRSGLRSTA